MALLKGPLGFMYGVLTMAQSLPSHLGGLGSVAGGFQTCGALMWTQNNRIQQDPSSKLT